MKYVTKKNIIGMFKSMLQKGTMTKVNAHALKIY